MFDIPFFHRALPFQILARRRGTRPMLKQSKKAGDRERELEGESWRDRFPLLSAGGFSRLQVVLV
jgi:hypothetical protein